MRTRIIVSFSPARQQKSSQEYQSFWSLSWKRLHFASWSVNTRRLCAPHTFSSFSLHLNLSHSNTLWRAHTYTHVFNIPFVMPKVARRAPASQLKQTKLPSASRRRVRSSTTSPSPSSPSEVVLMAPSDGAVSFGVRLAFEPSSVSNKCTDCRHLHMVYTMC